MWDDLFGRDVDWAGIGRDYASGAGEELLTFTREFVGRTDFGVYTGIIRAIVPAVLDRIDEAV